MTDITEALRGQLEEHSDLLSRLPEVVGWGVGLGSDGDPSVQVCFVARPSDGVIRQLDRVFDRFEVVIQSSPADAQPATGE